MQRSTKIVATLGPASSESGVLTRMIEAGVDVVRLNFSHGTHDDHRKRVDLVRDCVRRVGRTVGIMVDLQGPKIRVGKFAEGKVELANGAPFILDAACTLGDATRVGLDYPELVDDVTPGAVLLLDDGRLVLDVESIQGREIHCRVRVGGTLSNNKGINRQGGGLSAPALTDKDKEDIRLAAEFNADYVAVSFPKSGADIRQARELLAAAGSDALIIAKIERTEAIAALEDILQASDAIMQRICHIGFDLASHTPESKTAADALGQIGVERLSGFILKACLAEKKILETFDERVPHHERRLLQVEGVRNLRIVKNHAMLAALVDALAHVVPVGAAELRQTQAFIEDMAAERQEAINADHPVVQEFWDVYDFLDGDNRLNHSRNDSQISINLPQFIAKAAEARQQIPDLRDLKKALKTSRARKFIEIKTVNSALNAEWNKEHCPPNQPRPSTAKCWVFEAAQREPSR